MPSTTQAQEAAHKLAVAAAEGEKQRALMAAKQAYSGLGVDWAVYNAAVKAADVAYVRALMVSYAANGLGTGPSRTLHELTGQDT
jgi:hypothetical protein